MVARTASTAAECRAEEPLPASREEGAAKYGSYRLLTSGKVSRSPTSNFFSVRQAHAVVPLWELHALRSTGRKLPFPSLGRTAVRRSSPRRLLRDGLEQERSVLGQSDSFSFLYLACLFRDNRRSRPFSIRRFSQFHAHAPDRGSTDSAKRGEARRGEAVLRFRDCGS